MYKLLAKSNSISQLHSFVKYVRVCMYVRVCQEILSSICICFDYYYYVLIIVYVIVCFVYIMHYYFILWRSKFSLDLVDLSVISPLVI